MKEIIRNLVSWKSLYILCKKVTSKLSCFATFFQLPWFAFSGFSWIFNYLEEYLTRRDKDAIKEKILPSKKLCFYQIFSFVCTVLSRITRLRSGNATKNKVIKILTIKPYESRSVMKYKHHLIFSYILDKQRTWRLYKLCCKKYLAYHKSSRFFRQKTFWKNLKHRNYPTTGWYIIFKLWTN